LWRIDMPPFEQLWLSEDFLVTLHHESDEPPNPFPQSPTTTPIQCWDVPPRKRLGWIIGIPACLGAMLLLVRVGWRCARRFSNSGAAAGRHLKVGAPV
jgi:hypothetical protein